MCSSLGIRQVLNSEPCLLDKNRIRKCRLYMRRDRMKTRMETKWQSARSLAQHHPHCKPCQPTREPPAQGSHAQEPSSGRKSPECVRILMERPQLSWWSPPVPYTPDRAQQYCVTNLFMRWWSSLFGIWSCLQIKSPNSPALNSDLLDPSTSFHCRDSHPPVAEGGFPLITEDNKHCFRIYIFKFSF